MKASTARILASEKAQRRIQVEERADGWYARVGASPWYGPFASGFVALRELVPVDAR